MGEENVNEILRSSEDYVILYHLTFDQVNLLARHFGYDAEDLSKMEEYEVCEMLDKYIDELE